MLKLIQTCGSCPEQYDVYLEGECIGYMRLRYGSFRAVYRGEVVFEESPCGDGCFKSHERVKYLNKACKAIMEAHESQEEKPIYEIDYDDSRSTSQE